MIKQTGTSAPSRGLDDASSMGISLMHSPSFTNSIAYIVLLSFESSGQFSLYSSPMMIIFRSARIT